MSTRNPYSESPQHSTDSKKKKESQKEKLKRLVEEESKKVELIPDEVKSSPKVEESTQSGISLVAENSAPKEVELSDKEKIRLRNEVTHNKERKVK
jgi:hypothetical protein